MPDILSQGREPDPAPGRAPRWSRIALVLAAAAALTVVIVARLPHHGSPAPQPSSSPSRTPLAAGLILPGPARRNLPDEPQGVAGPTAAWAASLRLPVTGPQPAWFYPASGRRQPIQGLPASRAGYGFTRTAGGWAIEAEPPAGPVSLPGCGNCAGLPLPVWFLPDGASRVIPAGAANAVAPGAAPGTLWLTSYPRTARTDVASGTARQVGAHGRPLGPAVRLPAGYAIDQGTVRGLLLAPVFGVDSRPVLLWDPVSGHISRRLHGVLAASPGQVAWQEPCPGPCRIQVLDLASGRTAEIRLPSGAAVPSAAFSPDGSFLALQLSTPPGGDSGAAPTRLAVAATGGAARGRLRLVPGTSVSSDALAGFGWPARADRLVAELTFNTRTQVAAWRPGAPRLAVAPVRPGQHPAAMITG